MDRPTALDCSLHEPALYETRDGRVLRCACCERVQIEFRDHTLLVDAAEFETLLGTVVEVLDEVEGDDGRDGWRLTAPTDAGREVSVAFGHDALRALYELLAGAQAMRTLGERVGAVAAGACRERPATDWPR